MIYGYARCSTEPENIKFSGSFVLLLQQSHLQSSRGLCNIVLVEAMQQNANLQFLHHHCLLSPIFSRNSISHFLSIVNKNRQYKTGNLLLYCRFFRYLHRIIISVLLEIIPRHIPRDILPRRLFTAGSRRSSNTIPSQLARYAVVDVVRSGGQP